MGVFLRGEGGGGRRRYRPVLTLIWFAFLLHFFNVLICCVLCSVFALNYRYSYLDHITSLSYLIRLLPFLLDFKVVLH